MTTIFNGTPHRINFYNHVDVDYNSTQRKFIAKDGATPYLSIPPSGILLNCKTANATAPNQKNSPVPLVGAVKFISFDPLPDGYDLYIVSNLYRSAVQSLGGDTSKIATVADTVYNDSCNPCGCLALAVG